jgi:hypothetical protein
MRPARVPEDIQASRPLRQSHRRWRTTCIEAKPLWHTAKCGPFEYIEYWAHTSAPENVPHGADGIGPFSGCVDAAAHLLAALDSSEHLGIEATKRVVELLQPYALALVLATAKACGATTAPETWSSMLSEHFSTTAVLAKRRDHGSPLAHRLKNLGYEPPSQTHERMDDDSGQCCSDVDLVADLLQMLKNDTGAAQDVADSQARWRVMAAETTGAMRADAAHVLTDVESGILFRSRVLPVVDTLAPDELLMVGLPYMDDVDVTNDNGPSAHTSNSGQLNCMV